MLTNLASLRSNPFIVIQAYLKKQEEKLNKQPNFTPKETRKRRNEEPQG